MAVKKATGLDAATIQRIRDSIVNVKPGDLAKQVAYGPVCCCGVKTNWVAEGGGIPSKTCPVHPWSHVFARAGK